VKAMSKYYFDGSYDEITTEKDEMEYLYEEILGSYTDDEAGEVFDGYDD
jgi:hypothetical protein